MKTIHWFIMVIFLFGSGIHAQSDLGLPFIEDWDSGNFAYNEWILVPEYTNWSVNNTTGNPSPSADFSWEPARTNYSLSLESPWLFSGYQIFTTIWCDFDIKLADVNSSGNERLFLDVFHNGTWINRAWFSNTENMDWTTKHVALLEASDTTFKIRFRAEGMNSAGIEDWYIDNIKIFMKCNPPVNLSVQNTTNNEITLTWSEPEGNIEGPEPQWIHWDNGINYSSVGTCGNCSWDVAARWDASQLTDLEGGAVTQISFFPSSYGSADFRIRVWQGNNASTMLVDQAVPSVIYDQWNTIDIANPVPIDITQDLWIGYNMWEYYGMEAGCDAGPAFDGYGDMFCWAGIWYSMHEYSGYIDYNWNIQGYVETMDDHIPDSSFLIGYNLYRSDDNNITYNKLNTTPITDTNYIDHVPGYQEYCYYVTSLFEIDYGVTCESDSSNVTCTDVVNSVAEMGAYKISVYPNPSGDKVVFSAEIPINGIELFDFTGMKVFDIQDLHEKEKIIDVSTLKPGIYFTKISSGDVCTMKKITVLH